MLSSTLLASFIFAAINSGNYALAQQCKNLCNTNNQVLTLQACTDQTVSSQTMKVCCDDGAGRDNCPDDRKCRSVTVDKIVGCSNPGQGELHCINPAEVVAMTLNIEAEAGPGDCCSNCHCSGDPHCFAFDNKFDEWVICDGRDTSKKCTQTKTTCDTQKDQLGNQCIFSNGKCIKDSATAVPEMLLYKKGNTAITLTLGERGILDTVVIKEGDNVLSITASDCRDYPTAPWVGTPIGSLIRKKYGKLWTYTMPSIKASVDVSCITKGTFVKSPHLDISVVDQTISNGAIPPTISGFCASGKIDTQKATRDVTDNIKTTGICSRRPLAETALVFNGGVVPKNLRKVVVTFCQKYVVADKIGRVGRCAKEVMSKKGPGWAAVYCAANTVLTREVSDCQNSATCLTCISDVEDFGWDYVIEKYDLYKKKGPKPGPPCIPLDQLPADLFECQRGIRIQYFDTTTNVWVTYKAIPHGYTVCPASGQFNSNDDRVLFQNKIRFIQCGQEQLQSGTCPDTGDECDAEYGFKITVSTQKKTETPQLSVVDLVSKGSLICNPTLYPNNPNGCFEEPLNPCPTCTGKCAPSGFVTICTNDNSCGTCPDPFN